MLTPERDFPIFVIPEQSMQNTLEILTQLSEIPLICSDKTVALAKIAELARQALNSRLCTVALVNLEDRYLIAGACSGCDQALEQVVAERRFELGSHTQGASLDYDLVASGGIIEKHGLQTDGQGIIDPQVARRYGIDSALCYPLKSGKQLLGYLNHFAIAPVGETERKLLEIFARQAIITIENLENQASRSRLEKLNEVMRQMSEARDVEALLTLTLDAALDLVGTDRGWISRLDLDTGMLYIATHRGNPPKLRPLAWGKGITGKALIKEQPICVDDVRTESWRGVYEEFWPDTCAELAVPIVEFNADVHVGSAIQQGTKPIGVLNIESPNYIFTKTDEAMLGSLARQAAVMIERLETDRKLADLARVQQEIVAKRDWEEVIQVLMDAITGTLGYHFVNISIVEPELGIIRTEYARGSPRGDDDEFKRQACHALESADIQADIVRTKAIEVPGQDDERFDRSLYRQFGHDQLIRCFVPMIGSTGDQDGRVIGTVEVGYQRRYRKYIYERDVQVLKGFVDYAVQALEQRKKGLLDKISHELKASVVGIRSNASFLQRRRKELPVERIDRKLDDILADCEILLYQVAELGHILGRKQPEPKIARTLLFRDVIIKTLTQLKPLVVEHGFAFEKIEYDIADMYKIEPLYIDRSQLNQVVYNLLINAIKYAEREFRVQIAVERTREDYVVKFRDWGMGVRDEMRGRIFDDGFRTPEAIARYPNGSGLGLTIARKIMRSYGGDLLLERNRYPTEFHMILPKSLKEKPHDSVR